ncbi:MAG: MFS transporter [Candidatus Limnocylindrales bacterium]
MSEGAASVGTTGRRERLARLPLLAPLRVRDYRLVWFGESVSLLGDQFHYVALSWLVLELTGSGLALGTVLLASSLPRGVFLLFGGVLADRISPRTLMLVSNVVRAMLTALIAALVFGSQIQLWQLIVAGAIFGTVDAVFYPAISTIVARLVRPEQLPSANALLQGTQQLMSTVGPALAGIAVALIGIGSAFAIDAASFAVAATALWLIRRDGVAVPIAPQATDAPVDGPPTPTAPLADASTTQPRAEHPSLLTALVEGVRAVLGDPTLRILVILSAAFNVAFTGPVVVGLPWLVRVRFEGDASMLGLLLAVFGAGSVIGIALVGSLPRPRSLGVLVLGIGAGLGIGLAAIGLVPWQASLAILLLEGAGVGYLNVSIISWTQVRTEPHLLGRTMSFLMLGSVVAAPLSLAMAGVLVDTGATAMFLLAGGLLVAVCVAGAVTGLARRMTW